MLKTKFKAITHGPIERNGYAAGFGGGFNGKYLQRGIGIENCRPLTTQKRSLCQLSNTCCHLIRMAGASRCPNPRDSAPAPRVGYKAGSCECRPVDCPYLVSRASCAVMRFDQEVPNI